MEHPLDVASTRMMWRCFDALLVDISDVLVPFKVVLDIEAQDFVGLESLQHLAVNT